MFEILITDNVFSDTKLIKSYSTGDDLVIRDKNAVLFSDAFMTKVNLSIVNINYSMKIY